MIEQTPDTTDQTLIAEASNKGPNWVPWSAQQTFRAVLLTLIPWIVFNLTLSALGGNAASTQQMTAAQDIAGAIVTFIFTALVEGIFLIAPFYVARKALGRAKEAVPAAFRAACNVLGLRRFNLARTLLLILGLLVLVFAFDTLYEYIIKALHLHIMTNDQVVLQQSKAAPLTTYALLAGSVLFAPFCEELFFRGLVLPGLLRELSSVWAVLISAALFAIAHVDPNSFLPLFVIGIALGVLRLRSGSTWATISLHVLNNLLSSVMIVLAMHGITLPF